MKLSPKKCSFFKEQVTYVGHIVSANGIQTDPEKTQKIVDWPRPHNSDEVRRFLGFAGYYGRFVAGFSKIAKPLNDLLVGVIKKKGGRKTKDSGNFN